MTEVLIEKQNFENEIYTFEILIKENWSRSRHTVYFTDQDLSKYGRDKETPEKFIKRCFDFLLKKESKEEILPEFSVSDIAHYFPGFKDEMSLV